MRTGYPTLMRALLLAVLLALPALLVWPSQAGHAELVRLADGSVMQVEIVDFNDETVTLRRLDNGGEFRVRWSQLAEQDRDRLRTRLGLELPEIDGVLTEQGDRLELYDGTVYEGRIDQSRSGEHSLIIEYLVYDEWEEQRVERRDIADAFHDVQINARNLLTSEELYRRLVSMYPPDVPETHFLLAQYCRELGLYEYGLAHLNAIEDEQRFQEMIGPLRELFEELIEQAEIREMLHEARILLRRGDYQRSLDRIEEVLGQDELSDVIREDAEELYMTWRREAGTAIGQRYLRLIEETARDKVRGDIEPNDLRRFAASGRRGFRNPEEIPEQGSSEWDDLTMQEQIQARLYAQFDLDMTLIEELFAERDRDQMRALSVRLPNNLLEMFGGGVSADDDGRNEARDRRRERLERRMREMRERQEMREAQADRQGLPQAEERFDSFTGNGPLFQRRPGGSGMGAGSSPDRGRNGGEQQLTPEELWQRTRTGTRRELAVFLFCERHAEIERITARGIGSRTLFQYR